MSKTEEQPMRCYVCGGEIQNTITDLPFKLADHRILVVKSSPVEQCSSCGEYLLSDHVMQDLEDIIESTDRAAELDIRQDAA